jgi:hypothetical protein
MKTHKLMIKTHNITKLKYLCYTRSEGKIYEDYKGSGKLWKKHLKKYGENITTELIFESSDFEKFKKFAIQKSIEFDIVNSDQWANLKIEEGDGGDTVSNKRWITNGIKDKYLNKDLPLPEGWMYGRSNCIFNDPEKQSVFGKHHDGKKQGESLKKTWSEGRFKRDHSKCGLKGDLSPSKRPEVKEKIRQYALTESEIRSERMKKLWQEGKLSGRKSNKTT